MELSPHITIINATRGGASLEECYFEEYQLEQFRFFVPGNPPDPPILVSNGETFSFPFGEGLIWTITFYYSDATRQGQGNWSVRKLDSEDDPETGTFQAQGGPTTVAEDELSASASASA